MTNEPTHADNFRVDPNFRLVATFPLNGHAPTAYTVWEYEGSKYAVCDIYGFNFACVDSMREALDLCLRNCGWGLRTRLATSRDYA